MIHHMAVIIYRVWLVLYFQGKFMFFVIVRYISELSTPVVNTLWVLVILNRKGLTLFLVTSITMVVVFFSVGYFPSGGSG